MPKLNATLNASRNEATVEFSAESGVTCAVTLTQPDLLRLVQALGKLHANMSDGQEIPPLKGQQIDCIFDTRWL